jgi:hypothetical protein
MAGLTHLSDVYNKKGKEFLDDLFNKKLTVTEKPDGSIISAQKSENGPIFFKRDDRQPISKLDRTIISLYEEPIDFITKKMDKIDVPSNLRFGFEYFQNTNPVSIAYDRLPKNSLVLTHMKKMDGDKVVEFIDNPNILKSWAKKFDVEEPYVIFDGKLDKNQKEELIRFLETPFEDLVKRFSTSSFTKYIVSVLNPLLKKMALHNTTDSSIEGLVFKFNDGEYLAKVVDPVFTQAAKDKAKDRIEGKKSSDEFALILNSFISWTYDTGSIESTRIEGDDQDEKYIDLMVKLTKRYIEDNKIFLSGVKIDKPDFAKAPEFRLNTKMLRDRDIVDFIKKNPDYEDMFKMLLSGFKKPRTKKTELIDDNLKNQINRVVNNIKNRISVIGESFMSFSEWKKQKNNL